MARPRKPRAEKKALIVAIKLTPGDKKRLDAVAAKERLPVATVARLYVMLAVDKAEPV
jgi:hypothetical protein